VITEFRGRGDEVHIQPLSFSEFIQTFDGSKYDAWSKYLLYGGMPLAATMATNEQKTAYLQRLFSETYLKDILEHNRIQKTVELDELIDVLASSVGSLSNPTKIAATFKSKTKSSISPNTVQTYIDFLEDSFLISKASRFDVKGRHYIGSSKKYYFADVGLRNARLGFRQIEETHLMENVVYNELRSRGMLVDVGVVPVRERNKNGNLERKQLEIDFVATRGSKKYYIQSAFAIPDETKREQEEASLIRVPDSFRKIILVGTPSPTWHDERGVTFMNVLDFLLDENGLDK
jgi:predicted AAA+ superfamily ATPase